MVLKGRECNSVKQRQTTFIVLNKRIKKQQQKNETENPGLCFGRRNIKMVK